MMGSGVSPNRLNPHIVLEVFWSDMDDKELEKLSRKELLQFAGGRGNVWVWVWLEILEVLSEYMVAMDQIILDRDWACRDPGRGAKG